MRWMILFGLLILPVRAFAGPEEIVQQALDDHILPGFADLARAGEDLATAFRADCDPTRPAVQEAYSRAFDAWLGVSHLRFGPTEVDNRAFALAFWPDPRGKTPKALGRLVRAADPVVGDPVAFQSVSVAARGLYALERLLFDPGFAGAGAAEYRCALIRAVTADIALTARQIRDDWTGRYASAMTAPGGGDDAPYRTSRDALAALYGALATGLQFASEMRLGRPLGTFQRPRPNRAEARRSGRSRRNLVKSLEAMAGLAAILASAHPAIAAEMQAAFDAALNQAKQVDSPVLAGVADPVRRLKIEILQQRIDRIRELMATDLGPALGVARGFNALDGD